MLKRIIPLLIFVNIFMFSAVITAYGQNITIKVDGLLHANKVEPVIVEGYTMVGMREIFEMLGANLDWNDRTKSVIATKDDTTIEVAVGKTEATVNGKTKYLLKAPFIQNSTVMVPLRFISEAFNAKVNWDEGTKTITIDTGKKPLTVININQPATPNAVVFSYDEALKKAINANSSLKNLNESIDYIEEQRKDTQDTYYSEPVLPGTSSELALINAMRTVYALQDTLNNIPLNEQIIKDTTEYMLRSTLSNIAVSQMNIQLLEESIEKEKQDIRNLELKLSLGMASQNDITQAKQNNEKNLVSLSMLKLTLQSDMDSLKKILVMDKNTEVVVNYEPKIQPLSSNMDGYISGKVSDDPTIKMKRRALEQAQYNLNIHLSDYDESRIKFENELNVAARDLNDSERALETAIRSTYNGLKQLEEKGKSLEIDLQKAKDSYNTLVTQYEAGMVTMNEINAAKLGILNAEVEIKKNAFAYWTTIFALEHPFLLSASGSSSSK